jgi:hypothetical protein
MGIRRLDDELAAVRHGVAGIDREVEDCTLELVGVAQGCPEPACRDDLQGVQRADGPAQQVLHGGDELVGVNRLRIERLAAREGEQSVGERGSALG